MSATIAQVRARVLALAAAYPGMGTDISMGASITSLPAYTCVAGVAVWRKLSTQRYLVDRNYELWVYVDKLTDSNREDLTRAQIDDCDPWIVGLASYYSARPRLELNDAGIVHDVQDISDSGPAQTPLRNQIYSGFRLIIPTTVSAP